MSLHEPTISAGSPSRAADQVQLVADPAIAAVLAAEAVFDRVDALLEEAGDLALDAGEVVGVDAARARRPGSPDIRSAHSRTRSLMFWLTKVGAKVAGRLEAVDHRRRRAQQPRQTLLRRRLHLGLALPTVALALQCRVPYGLLDDGDSALVITVVGRDAQDAVEGRGGVYRMFSCRRHCLSAPMSHVPGAMPGVRSSSAGAAVPSRTLCGIRDVGNGLARAHRPAIPAAPARARSSTSRSAWPWHRRWRGRSRRCRTDRASACRTRDICRARGRACRRRAAGRCR